jgi:hypothetical protein
MTKKKLFTTAEPELCPTQTHSVMLDDGVSARQLFAHMKRSPCFVITQKKKLWYNIRESFCLLFNL